MCSELVTKNLIWLVGCYLVLILSESERGHIVLCLYIRLNCFCRGFFPLGGLWWYFIVVCGRCVTVDSFGVVACCCWLQSSFPLSSAMWFVVGRLFVIFCSCQMVATFPSLGLLCWCEFASWFASWFKYDAWSRFVYGPCVAIRGVFDFAFSLFAEEEFCVCWERLLCVGVAGAVAVFQALAAVVAVWVSLCVGPAAAAFFLGSVSCSLGSMADTSESSQLCPSFCFVRCSRVLYVVGFVEFNIFGCGVVRGG